MKKQSDYEVITSGDAATISARISRSKCLSTEAQIKLIERGDILEIAMYYLTHRGFSDKAEEFFVSTRPSSEVVPYIQNKGGALSERAQLALIKKGECREILACIDSDILSDDAEVLFVKKSSQDLLLHYLNLYRLCDRAAHQLINSRLGFEVKMFLGNCLKLSEENELALIEHCGQDEIMMYLFKQTEGFHPQAEIAFIRRKLEYLIEHYFYKYELKANTQLELVRSKDSRLRDLLWEYISLRGLCETAEIELAAVWTYEDIDRYMDILRNKKEQMSKKARKELLKRAH